MEEEMAQSQIGLMELVNLIKMAQVMFQKLEILKMMVETFCLMQLELLGEQLLTFYGTKEMRQEITVPE